MITVEGYKAFYGTMKITSADPKFPTETITGEWLFKPEYNRWYCNGRSYPDEICEVVEDLTGSAGVFG